MVVKFILRGCTCIRSFTLSGCAVVRFTLGTVAAVVCVVTVVLGDNISVISCNRRLTLVLSVNGMGSWRSTKALANSSNAAVVRSANAVAGNSNFVGIKTYVSVTQVPLVSGM